MKEELLRELEEVLKKEYGFQPENFFKLNKRELEMLLAILGKARIHEKALLEMCAGNPDKLEAVCSKVAEKEGLKVRATHV